ncbi:valine--tRNA ligase, partial [bacterium]|nr:valine--tRNA ligase [bacterium]
EPNMWCVECQTAIAQAELDAEDKDSSFNDLRFEIEGGGSVVIGTTRPELLPSCSSLFVHPDDQRYKDLVGKYAIVPIFSQKVPILHDPKADMEKGTGAVMCCTFGDKTDIEWYKQHGLQLRVSITPYGRMTSLAAEYEGLKIKEARKQILKRCEEEGILLKSESISHPVNTHERCGTDIEFLSTQQWFIRVIDRKDELLELAEKIKWFPSYMKQRYVHWVENLNWDWCISRQRFFGVPFPVWHCQNCHAILTPEMEDLPVDPQEQPYGRDCVHCGHKGILPDRNIMDTWATSSVSPQINYLWGEKDSLEDSIAPMSLRPQAHDIIRTWAFYTMVKSWYHHGEIPWKDIMISGHVLYKKGQKISKSKGNAKSEPETMIEQYGADVIRYWTAGAKLGSDCYFEEQEFRIASKLVTKIFNASKFSLTHLEGFDRPDPRSVQFPLDRGLLSILNRVIQRTDRYLSDYEYSLALSEVESFFWDFCDNYLELIKHRSYNPDEHLDGGHDSVRSTLYTALYAVLRMLAPFIPHITEEIYQAYFRQREDHASVHITSFPEASDSLMDEEAEELYRESKSFVGAIRKFKTEQRMSLNTELKTVYYIRSEFSKILEAGKDVARAARCDDLVPVNQLPQEGEAIEFEGKTLKVVCIKVPEES